ncbi:HypC/HybG/HupF family hydrogenase formation chaperone [Sideroxydans sp. CL21]|uniref:HypC/HybG/HupF family hydrogenase formation chaperone n=1 Tax=Sideroxydans sp. CL21 TaxID=2600596 RepID=UPI0024BC12DA|nr:HypC/HybG/HupF family hydrogenase formation chaperone [Sideroxydans sp. CL21]
MAIPSRVVALSGEMATVECFGEQRDVSLMLMDGPLALGDYVLVQAGGFAYERVTPTRAQETLDILSAVIGQPAAA